MGVGISANTGPRVTLEHRHRRPFGMNWVATNKFEFGSLIKSWTGELISPAGRPVPQPAGRQRRAAALRRGDPHLVDGAPRAARRTRSASSAPTSPSSRTHASTTPSAARAARRSPPTTTGSTATSTASCLPTDGYTVSLQSAAGRSRNPRWTTAPSAVAMAAIAPTGRWGPRLVRQPAPEAGQIIASDAGGRADTLLFRAGGDDSVRGYAYRTLGPLVDGVDLAACDAYRQRRSRGPGSGSCPRWLRAVFADAGNAANHWKGSRAWGPGLGLRWQPGGPLRVDLACQRWKWRKVRLHLSVGIAF